MRAFGEKKQMQAHGEYTDAVVFYRANGGEGKLIPNVDFALIMTTPVLCQRIN